MSLDTLLEDVFRNGCGVSRKQALKSARFQELLTTVPHVTHTSRHEVAEMIYLGELLADRAFKNLPKYYQEEAYKWQSQSPEMQQILLTMMMMEFTSKSWTKRLKSRRSRSLRDVDCVLPHQCGSWTRGKFQPNCLGLAQMMVGFARATGEHYCLVDTIRSHDGGTLRRMYVTADWLVQHLDGYADTQLLVRKHAFITRCRDSMLNTLTDFPDLQAHHALAMRHKQLWFVVDPYMNRYYPLTLNKRWDKAFQELGKGNPRRGIITESKGITFRIQHLKSAVTHVTTAIDDARKSGKAADLESIIWDAAFELTLGSPHTTKQRMVEMFGLLNSHVLSTPYLGRVLSKLDESEHTKEIERLFAVYSVSPRYHELALQRLLGIVAHQAVVILYDLQADMQTEHPVIELYQAPYHLAVMTLNHRAGQLGLPAGDLVRFSASQFILRDIMTEVRTGDNAKLQAILDIRLRALARKVGPSMVMPEIQAHLPKKKE